MEQLKQGFITLVIIIIYSIAVCSIANAQAKVIFKGVHLESWKF